MVSAVRKRTRGSAALVIAAAILMLLMNPSVGAHSNLCYTFADGGDSLVTVEKTSPFTETLVGAAGHRIRPRWGNPVCGQRRPTRDP